MSLVKFSSNYNSTNYVLSLKMFLDINLLYKDNNYVVSLS